MSAREARRIRRDDGECGENNEGRQTETGHKVVQVQHTIRCGVVDNFGV